MQNKSYSIESMGTDAKGNSNEFALTVNGFETEKEALNTGFKFKRYLSLLGVKLRIGIDVSQDPHAIAQEGIGLDIGFKSATWKASRSVQDFGDNLISILEQVSDLDIEMKESLVLELYGASHFEHSPRAQFLTLMTLLEVLVESRSKEVLNLVGKFQELLNESGIDRNEKNSIKSSLDEIKTKKKMNEGLNNLAQNYLDKKEYVVTYLCQEYAENRKCESKTAYQFLFNCYIVRCNLVHEGNCVYIEERNFDFAALTSELNRLVSDLLLKKLGLK